MTSITAFPVLAILLQSSTNAIISTIFMYGALGAIFYFIILRPQRQQRKTHEDLVRSLKRGDEVVTSGGIIGEVVHIQGTGGKDAAASMEDRITIKSAESRMIIERGRITKVTRDPGNATSGQ